MDTKTIKRLPFRRARKTENGHLFYRWSQLTESEKKKNTELTNTLFEFCYDHPGVEVTFEMMNKVGLVHLYSFRVEDYNDTHVSKMILSDTGCRCVRENV